MGGWVTVCDTKKLHKKHQFLRRSFREITIQKYSLHYSRGCQLNRSKQWKSMEVNRSDRSKRSKSIEVIVEVIEVNQSFKKCKSLIGFDRFQLASIGFDWLRLTLIGFNWLWSASIDFDWLWLITIVWLTHLQGTNPKVDGTSLSHYSLYRGFSNLTRGDK